MKRFYAHHCFLMAFVALGVGIALPHMQIRRHGHPHMASAPGRNSNTRSANTATSITLPSRCITRPSSSSGSG